MIEVFASQDIGKLGHEKGDLRNLVDEFGAEKFLRHEVNILVEIGKKIIL